MSLYYPGVVQLPSANHSPRRDATPDVLVLHIMAGSLAACDSWFQSSGNTESSAHFGIGKDGTVHQYVSVGEASWSNGIVDDMDHGPAQAFLASLPAGASPNRYSVSIEHEGQSGDDMTPEQFIASVGVAAWLFGPGGALEGKAVDREHIIRHSEIGSHPLCPGFTEERFTKYIAAVNAALGGAPAPVQEDDVKAGAGLSQSEAVQWLLDVVNNKEALIANGGIVHVDGQPKTYIVTLP